MRNVKKSKHLAFRDPYGRKTDIDYSKDGKTILWQCIDVCTASMLKRTKVRFGPDDFDDAYHDVMVMTFDYVQRGLQRGKWDGKWPFFNFVWAQCWSASSAVIRRYVRDKRRRLDMLSLDTIVDDDGIPRTLADTIGDDQRYTYVTAADRTLYRRRHDGRAKNSVTLDKYDADEYDLYCECCADFGKEPLTRKEYDDLKATCLSADA